MKGEQANFPEFSETRAYSIPADFYREGYRAFQSKYVMPRNYVLMAVFFLLLLSFIWSAAENPTNALQYFLGIVCIAAICLLWYNPRHQRKQVFEAAQDLADDRYIARQDDGILQIESISVPENRPTRLAIAGLTVRHLDGFYLLCNGKQMFYILPDIALEPTDDASESDVTPLEISDKSDDESAPAPSE